MKIRDLEGLVVSEIKITFDEDPHNGKIDVIVPLTAEHLSDVLGDGVLDLDIYLIKATDNTVVISTNSRGF